MPFRVAVARLTIFLAWLGFHSSSCAFAHGGDHIVPCPSSWVLLWLAPVLCIFGRRVMIWTMSLLNSWRELRCIVYSPSAVSHY